MRNQASNKKHLLEFDKRRLKLKENELNSYVLTTEKHFLKTRSQQKLVFGLFTKVPRIIIAPGFSLSLFKLKGGILPLDKISILT